jgi:hypothetical protein
MCVIMIAQRTRPSDEMIKRAWARNSDGFGIAWRESNDKGVSEVVWQKGIKSVDEAMEIIHKTPLPFACHFRVATVGGPKPTLTHPFLVNPNASTELSGRTKGAVLFHNGHWTEWNDKCLDAAIRSNNKPPVGDWSDSRGLAWMTNIYGRGFLELMTQQKVVVWTATDFRVFTGKDGFEQINDVWCSNDYFWIGKQKTVYGSPKLCRETGCTNSVQDWGMKCYSCQQKQFHQETKLADPSEEHTSSTTSEKKDGNTGAPALAAIGGQTPLVQCLTLEDATELRKRGGMSKNKHKEFVRAWELKDEKGNRGERAKKELIYISNHVAKALLHGSVH